MPEYDRDISIAGRAPSWKKSYHDTVWCQLFLSFLSRGGLSGAFWVLRTHPVRKLGDPVFRLATCRNPSTAGTASTSVSVDYIARRTTVPPSTEALCASSCKAHSHLADNVETRPSSCDHACMENQSVLSSGSHLLSLFLHNARCRPLSKLLLGSGISRLHTDLFPDPSRSGL